MKRFRMNSAIALFLTSTTLLLISCAVPAPEDQGTPAQTKSVGIPIARLDVRYLDPPVSAAAEAVAEAQAALGTPLTDPSPAQLSLERAASALGELTDFYLPLTRARNDLIAAYSAHLENQPKSRDADLEAADIQLSWAIEHAGDGQSESATEVLTLLDGLQQLDRSSSEFESQLAQLCQDLQLRLVNSNHRRQDTPEEEAQS